MECFVRKYNIKLNDTTLPLINRVDAELCAHRLGKKMTYTEQSDTFRGGAEDIMAYADNLGIKLGVFWGMSTNSAYRDLALPYVIKGMMWIDAYSNPTGASELGQINRDVYEAQKDALLQRINDWFGKRPIALSYAYGNDSYKDYIENDFLGGRNSNKNGGTPYGVGYGSPDNVAYNINYFKSKASTSRWYDDAKNTNTFTERLQQLREDVLATKENGGWYNNFTHWHNVISDGNLEAYRSYLELLSELNTNNDIYFAGYGEALAYLAYREIVKGVSAFLINGSINISLTLKTDPQVNNSLLIVPVSVRFSVADTPLEDKTLICEGGNLVELGGNEYIVEIPYSENPFCTIKINN